MNVTIVLWKSVTLIVLVQVCWKLEEGGLLNIWFTMLQKYVGSFIKLLNLHNVHKIAY